MFMIMVVIKITIIRRRRRRRRNNVNNGNDNMHKQLREGYGFIPKPQARKIKNYLQNILDDATRYSNDRRPGRRKKDSK